MNEVLESATSALPVLGNTHFPANVISSEREQDHAYDPFTSRNHSAIPERRQGVSDLEFASVALSHAVRYLISEQRAGRCINVRGSRQAVTILCECAESLIEVERREPAREALTEWLASARPA